MGQICERKTGTSDQLNEEAFHTKLHTVEKLKHTVCSYGASLRTTTTLYTIR